MFEDFKPGNTIRVTITRSPRSEADIKTMRRLMRMPTEMERARKVSKKRREAETVRHPRGGRIWAQRPSAAKLVRPEAGQTWEMPYRPQILPDLASVSRFVKVEKA